MLTPYPLTRLLDFPGQAIDDPLQFTHIWWFGIREPPFRLAGYGAQLHETIGSSRTRQTVQPDLELIGGTSMTGLEVANIGTQLLEARGQGGQVLSSQRLKCALHLLLAHGIARSFSSASSAAATKAAAVLQCPCTLLPCRDPMSALASSTMQMSGASPARSWFATSPRSARASTPDGFRPPGPGSG